MAGILLGTTTSTQPPDQHLPTPTPLHAGGNQKMIVSHICAQQLIQELWLWEQLVHEQAIALEQAIDVSTWGNYSLALNSYLTFVWLHNIPVEPTANTLSLYTVYMCHHIKPDSVDTYLSVICQQLEPYFLKVHEARRGQLVHHMLEGCKHLHGTPTIRKHALTIDGLNCVLLPLWQQFPQWPPFWCTTMHWFLCIDMTWQTYIPQQCHPSGPPQSDKVENCTSPPHLLQILAWP